MGQMNAAYLPSGSSYSTLRHKASSACTSGSERTDRRKDCPPTSGARTGGADDPTGAEMNGVASMTFFRTAVRLCGLLRLIGNERKPWHSLTSKKAKPGAAF